MKNFLRMPISAMSLLILGAFSAHAASVVVPNASFETPSPAQVVTPSQSTKSLTDSTTVSDWIFNINGPSQYGTRAISSTFASPGTSSGNDYIFFNNDQDTTDTITSAASLGTIMSQTQYTLTVAIGNPNGKDTTGYDTPGTVSFSLLANDVAFATDTVTAAMTTDGTFKDFTLTFTTPGTASPIIGEDLKIQLSALPQASLAAVAAFDNVRLDVTLVPEPKTWALLVPCVLALMGMGIKRRFLAAA